MALLTVEVFGTRHMVEDAVEIGSLVEVHPVCENFVSLSHKDEAARWIALGASVECPDCLRVHRDRTDARLMGER